MLGRLQVRLFRSVFKGRTSAWAQRDYKEAQEIHMQEQLNPTLQKLQHEWQHGLELKKQYRERRAAREAAIAPATAQPPKLVVHSFESVASVSLPRPDQVFAVVHINGFQHKVTTDDLVMTDTLPYKVGDTVEFDSVLLVGTPEYSLLGRPTVTGAKVIAAIEEQTLSEKLLVFKMRRRKRYKKFQGHRQPITVLRIVRIEHEVAKEQPASLFLPLTGYKS